MQQASIYSSAAAAPMPQGTDITPTKQLYIRPAFTVTAAEATAHQVFDVAPITAAAATGSRVTDITPEKGAMLQVSGHDHSCCSDYAPVHYVIREKAAMQQASVYSYSCSSNWVPSH